MNTDLPGPQNNSNLPNKNKVVLAEISHSFSGPLPPPEVLCRFEEVVHGSAERIIKMAEEQTSHRKELEKKVIDSDIARSKW